METQNPFNLDGLTELGARTGVDMRPTLLRVLTDLYVHRLSHTPEEERHYTELALRLLEAVDVPTRAAVAKRFAGYLSPPLRIVHWLSGDLPEVRVHLRSHPLLQPSAPADQKQASEDLERADASHPMELAKADELTELFFAANADERRLILLNLTIVAPVSAGGIAVSRDPSVAQRLEAAVLGGNREAFAQELAKALRIPREQARRIARDELGEPVVVAAKALGMAREVLYRVLMFVNPAVGHSVARVHALAALFEEMTQPAAESMVAIWQALLQHDRPAAKHHRPLVWDDDAGRRARPASGAQRSPATPRTNERRSAS